MTQIGYLLRRLPPLFPELAAVPIGPEAFHDLLLDGELEYWAGGVLDWLRIANRQHVARNLPPPYPDARSEPRTAWPDDAWAAYYDRYTAITAPAILRGWMLEDIAATNARATVNGRAPLMATALPVDQRLDGLLQADAASPGEAARRDAATATFHFHWLDEHTFTAGPEAPERIHVYAVKLLVLLRNGLRLERDEAA